MASQFSICFGIFVCAVLSFQMVLSAPVLTPQMQNNNHKKVYQQPSFAYPIEEMEMLKRDFEEPIFIDPPEEDQFAVFYNHLPRTDRKIPSNYFLDQMLPINENPFENLPIELRSIPMDTVELSPPSQKELLGPIVVGPQTKSTQTSSLKKVLTM